MAGLETKGGDLSGIDRAAIFLMALGENEAAEVMKFMDAREVEAVGARMATFQQIPRDRAETVIGTFLGKADSAGFAVDGIEYVKRTLSGALGKSRAEPIVDRILTGAGGAGIETLKWMEPRMVAQLIGDEHPQVISSLLAQLDGKHVAKIVPLLPESLHAEVLMRIATLEQLPQNAISELGAIVSKRAATSGASMSQLKIGGTRIVADVVNAMSRDAANTVLNEIEGRDPDLTNKIRELLFVFDDLGKLDDKAMQAILREVRTDVLALALRGADPGVQDKIYRNMSKRAAEILKEDMDARGPVKLTEVEGAQREITNVAQRLAEEGTIILGASSTEYV